MISFLLAQATVAEDITQHPYLVLVIIGGLFSALIAVMKVLLGFMEKRVNEKFESITERFDDVNTREDKQEVRLDKIEIDLRGYDKHVALGLRESTEIHEGISRVEKSLSSHVEKEENTTWVKIDDLVTAVNEMKMSNEVAHAGLVAGQTILSNRVEAVEKKMPDGELEKLAAAYHALAERDVKRRPAARKRVNR
jgi:hypothetical protein